MAFGAGEHTVTLDDVLSRVSEFDILLHYFGVSEIPTVIRSPLRRDNHPSFGLNTPDGKRVCWIDYSTHERGGLFDLLMKWWGKGFSDTVRQVWNDIPKFSRAGVTVNGLNPNITVTKGHSDVEIQCRTREWMPHDIEYWESFGISLDWLRYADIYPISHKIVIRDGHRYVFGADRYAYAYVERKEGRVTLKIYQPFNRCGYKWSNNHDRSVISLWTKIPEEGDIVCVCSSMKDALCLWANTGIPSVAMQGEGYSMSDTAVSELRRRFDNVFILLDNDRAGLEDGVRLSQSTGFVNIVLPDINGSKDISDLFRSLHDPDRFRDIIIPLFKSKLKDNTTPF